METYRRQQAHRWVHEEIFNKVQDKGILENWDKYIVAKNATCHFSTKWRGKMMLRFSGSDYRRSLSSTWYDMMDNFMINQDFTKSKVGSNLQGWMQKTRICWWQNDVWDIVTKPKSKSVVSSKWTCKTKHVADGRQDLWLEDSLRERKLVMKRHLLPWWSGTYTRWM